MKQRTLAEDFRETIRCFNCNCKAEIGLSELWYALVLPVDVRRFIWYICGNIPVRNKHDAMVSGVVWCGLRGTERFSIY